MIYGYRCAHACTRAHRHTHRLIDSISKVNKVIPIINLGKSPQLLSHPPTSYLTPSFIAATFKMPFTPTCPSLISLPLSGSYTWPLSLTWFHLRAPAGSLPSLFSALASRVLFLKQNSYWATLSILQQLPHL